MSEIPTSFPNVTAVPKANVYFGGKVVSHTILLPGGVRKTLGLIHPGSFHFDTDAAELMEIVAGACSVVVDGASKDQSYEVGARFEIPGKSGFTITVGGSICEYICTFIA